LLLLVDDATRYMWVVLLVEFATYYADEGIQRHFSVPYTPRQNGVVERRNQTVLAMARALLKPRSLPAEFGGGGRQ
jgi:hypothetical protein